jgi:hypothetical protein
MSGNGGAANIPTLEHLAEQIAELDRARQAAETESAALRSEIAGLKRQLDGQEGADRFGMPAGGPSVRLAPTEMPTDPPGVRPAEGDRPMSRRGALLAMGGVAAGGLAAGSAFLGAEPAAANTEGEAVILGSDNTATSYTEIDVSGGSGDITALYLKGAGTFPGVRGDGGTSSGPGMQANGGLPNGNGIVVAAAGTGAGVVATGGASSGYGVQATGGGPNGDGIVATGAGGGSGVAAIGGAGGGTGVIATGQGSGGLGVQAVGGDQAAGVLAEGGTTSSPGVQATGGSPNGNGIEATASGTGSGVIGISNSNFGVVGASNGVVPPTSIGDGSVGVYGTCGTDGFGVVGVGSVGVQGGDNSTAGGTGVWGESVNGYGIVASAGRAPLFLVPASQTGPPTGASAYHQRGEIFVDESGLVFVCTADSEGTSTDPASAGTWQQIVVAAPTYYDNPAITGLAGQAGSVNLLSAPIRVFDSRVADSPGAPSRSAGVLAPGTAVTVQVAGTSVGGVEVPAGAVGVIGNVTAFSPTGNGKLTLYPTGGSVPSITNLNFQSSESAIGNLCIVPLGSGSDAGQMNIEISSGSPGSANVAFDVFGFVF